MIAVCNLTRRFGARLAVEDLSFELRAGEIFALLGPNGAGKTTTLRLLAGLIAPTSGTIRFEGHDVTPSSSAAIRSRIGLLTETPGLWERLSAFQNLSLYGRLYGLREPEQVAERSLRTFGLADRRDDPAGLLSKGMKQKLAIARALLHDPAVVLLDEPTAGLDPEIARTLRHLILRLRDDGRAVLVSTHNLDEAERIADRVAVLRTRLIALDTAESLRRRLYGRRLRVRLMQPAEAFVKVAAAADGASVAADGTVLSISVADPDLEVPRLIQALVTAGASIRAVEDESPSLEDVYLRLTGSSGP